VAGGPVTGDGFYRATGDAYQRGTGDARGQGFSGTATADDDVGPVLVFDAEMREYDSGAVLLDTKTPTIIFPGEGLATMLNVMFNSSWKFAAGLQLHQPVTNWSPDIASSWIPPGTTYYGRSAIPNLTSFTAPSGTNPYESDAFMDQSSWPFTGTPDVYGATFARNDFITAGGTRYAAFFLDLEDSPFSMTNGGWIEHDFSLRVSV